MKSRPRKEQVCFKSKNYELTVSHFRARTRREHGGKRGILFVMYAYSWTARKLKTFSSSATVA